MRLIPYRDEPFGLANLQSRMNRLFESFFDGERGEIGEVAEPALRPFVDIIETPETIQVKAELPGIAPADIEVSVSDNVLTIRGEKATEKEEKGKTWHRRERSWGQFFRSVALPLEVESEHVEAVDEAGVLTITLPKRESAKPRRIAVKAK